MWPQVSYATWLNVALVPTIADAAAPPWQDLPVLAGDPDALLLEAQGSSRIEGIYASLYEMEAGSPYPYSEAALCVANTEAIRSLIRASRFDNRSILAAHRKLLKASNPRIAGKYRRGLVRVGDYIAPEPVDIPALMADLWAFIVRDDMDPVTHAALAHAQFETIHPFNDGNGRIGRALVTALLHKRGLPLVPYSLRLAENRHEYYRALTSYRYGNTEPIIAVLTAALTGKTPS